MSRPAVSPRSYAKYAADAAMAALSVHSTGGGALTAIPISAPRAFDCRLQCAVRRNPARKQHLLHTRLLDRPKRMVNKHVNDSLLEARGDILDFGLSTFDFGLRLNVSNHGGLEPAEAEVERVADPRARERNRVRVAVTRELVDQRPAGVAQPHRPRALVERLARGIVTGSGEYAVFAMTRS